MSELATEPQTYSILLVDDDEATRIALKRALSQDPSLEILACESVLEALDRLSVTDVDLVITDLKMPDIDGFAFVRSIRASNPAMPILVVTGLPQEERPDPERQLDGIQILTKPVAGKDLIASVRRGLQARVSGHVRQLSVATFSQLLEVERRTCTLVVRKGKLRGILGFAKGRLTHARYGSLQGQEAALELLAWGVADVELREGQPLGPHPRITKSLQHLLLLAAKQEDEIAHDARSKAIGGGSPQPAAIERKGTTPGSDGQPSSMLPLRSEGATPVAFPTNGPKPIRRKKMSLSEKILGALASFPEIEGWILCSMDGNEIEASPPELSKHSLVLAFILARAASEAPPLINLKTLREIRLRSADESSIVIRPYGGKLFAGYLKAGGSPETVHRALAAEAAR